MVSGISDVYTYFRSVGVNGQQHDKWVTNTLSLIPKPNLLHRMFGCGQNTAKTNVAKVMITLDKIIKHDVEDPDTRKMATFIKGVLDNLRLKRDPHLLNLGRLNALFNSCEGLSHSKEVVENEYFSTGNFDPTFEHVRRLIAGDCGPFQQLAQDMIARIFTFLSLKDRAHATATCWNLYRAAARNDSFDLRALAPNEIFYVSTLTNKSVKGIKENRALIEAYKTHHFASSTIGYSVLNTGGSFQYQPGPNDPILIRNQSSIDIANTRRSIPHNFRNDYVVLYEKSIHKIFVLDKENNIIHGLYEIDPESGISVRLFEQNIQVTGTLHFTYDDNEIRIVTRFGSSYIYNRETGELSEKEWTLTPPIDEVRDHHFRGSNIIYENVRLGLPRYKYEIIDIYKFDLHGFSHRFSLDKQLHSLEPITPDFMLAHADNIVAVFTRNGLRAQVFTLPFPHFFYRQPSIQVNNGMLYTSTSPYATEAYDILTGKHVRTISFGLFRRNRDLQVFDNKLVYRVGDAIRMEALSK